MAFGLFKKVGDALSGKGATKNDVKLAKLELKKEKEITKNQKLIAKNQKEMQKQELSQESKNMIDSIVINVDYYVSETEKIILKVKNEKNEFEQSQNQKKKLFGNDQEFKLERDIEYLYLCKEFLILVNEGRKGVALSENQISFLRKFSKYYDGRDVLEEYDDEDESLFGSIKNAFKNIKNNYTFENLLSNYEEQVANHIIPDFTIVFNNIKQPAVQKVVEKVEPVKPTEPVEKEKTDTIVCGNCGNEIPVGSKFCMSCGAKIETVKRCPNCGNELMEGAKFCMECGTKVE